MPSLKCVFCPLRPVFLSAGYLSTSTAFNALGGVLRIFYTTVQSLIDFLLFILYILFRTLSRDFKKNILK